MDKLLSIDDLTEILGVTKATIYSWTSQNKIPHVKLSKRLLKFREQEIMDWISRKSVDGDTPVRAKKIKCYVGRHSNQSDNGIERIIRNAKEEILNRR